MSVSTQTKLDFVYKKALNRDMDNTGSNWFGESPGGGFLIPDTKLWCQAFQIPTTPPTSTNSTIAVYSGSGNMLALSEHGNVVDRCWTGSTTDIIPPLFGNGYAIRIFQDSAGTNEVNLTSAAYLSNVDYERSILWFETAQTSLPVVLYAQCYKYVGKKGFTGSLVHSAASFAVTGTFAVGTDVAPTIIVPCPVTITEVLSVVKTTPAGQNIIFDVNKNAITIFSVNPQIAVGGTTGSPGTIATGSLVKGDKLTIDIDQTGSAGADITIEVIGSQYLTF